MSVTLNTARRYLTEIRKLIKWILRNKSYIIEEYLKQKHMDTKKCIKGFIKHEIPLYKIALEMNNGYKTNNKKAERIADRFTIEEAELFLHHIKHSKKLYSECDYIITYLIYKYDMKICELLNVNDNKYFNGLKRSDIYVIKEQPYLTVATKGQEKRTIKIDIIDYYMVLDYYNKTTINENIFNCSESFNGKKIKPLDKASYWYRMNNYKMECEKLGIIRKGLKGSSELIRKVYTYRRGVIAEDIERK